MEKKQTWFGDHWLFLLIAAQPLLDTLAYFTQNEKGTVAGVLRLLLLIALPLWTLVKAENKKPYLLGFGVVGAFCLLYVLNGVRTRFWDLGFDLTYLLRVINAPVLCICFLCLLREEQTRRQAFRGILAAGLIMAVSIPVAWLTGTGNVTYGEGLGYTGWAIDDNRCANSILLVTLSCFAVWYAVKTERKGPALLIPPVITAIFLSNGTKACYASLFGIFFGFSFWMLLEKVLLKKKLKTALLILLVLLMVFSVVIYPWTPRYRVSLQIAEENPPGEIEAALLERGIDVTPMSFEERFRDPVVREVFEFYYRDYLGSFPDLIERFGIDKVFREYRMTTDVYRLIDARVIERTYAKLIWTEETDALTKFVGFLPDRVGTDGFYDMENDWHALFYYYGYLGFALYMGFLLWFLLRVVRRLKEDFKGSLTPENFVLALAVLLQLGLAHFSGAVVRRPNVSIYLALILALIWYQTRREEKTA